MIMKATTEVAYTPLQVFEALSRDDLIKIWDGNVEQRTYLKGITEDIYAAYWVRKGASGVLPRDFTVLTYVYRENDDLWIISFSEKSVDQFVPKKEKFFVRAQLYLTAQVLQKTETGTMISNIIEFDFKGFVP